MTVNRQPIGHQPSVIGHQETENRPPTTDNSKGDRQKQRGSRPVPPRASRMVQPDASSALPAAPATTSPEPPGMVRPITVSHEAKGARREGHGPLTPPPRLTPHASPPTPPPNPCLAIVGTGPEGRLCGECAKLSARHEDDGANARPRTIYFCSAAPSAEARRRVTAPACALFELSALSRQLIEAAALRLTTRAQ